LLSGGIAAQVIPDHSLAPKPSTERARGKHCFAPAASAVRI
jgi:hypothetical protein